jgi:uncharacterized membrane protein YhhN
LFLKQGITLNYRKKITFWIGFILILLYLNNILTLLLPRLGDLQAPVTVYAMTISLMLMVALCGYFTWRKPASIFILIGAMAFVTSDSILAINKFYEPLNNASFLIMFSYLIAQICITKGTLNLNQKK